MVLIKRVIIEPKSIDESHGTFCGKQRELACNCIIVNGLDYYYFDGDAQSTLDWLETVKNLPA